MSPAAKAHKRVQLLCYDYYLISRMNFINSDVAQILYHLWNSSTQTCTLRRPLLRRKNAKSLWITHTSFRIKLGRKLIRKQKNVSGLSRVGWSGSEKSLRMDTRTSFLRKFGRRVIRKQQIASGLSRVEWSGGEKSLRTDTHTQNFLDKARKKGDPETNTLLKSCFVNTLVVHIGFDTYTCRLHFFLYMHLPISLSGTHALADYTFFDTCTSRSHFFRYMHFSITLSSIHALLDHTFFDTCTGRLHLSIAVFSMLALCKITFVILFHDSPEKL